jgi:sugar phosphate permease
MSQPAFRGWWIVATGFVCQGIAIGLTIIPYGLFATPLQEDLGASVGEFQLGIALFTLVMTGAGSQVGRLLDSSSIRAVMASGSLLLSASFFAMSLATELWQLALAFGVGGAVAVSMCGPLPVTTVIAKWFDRKRGGAVGLAAMGIPAGGVLLTPLAGLLLDTLGWRGTLQAFSGIALLIAPLAMWAVRNTPESLGQFADGDSGDPEEGGLSSEAPVEFVWSTREVLASRNFWALAVGVGIVFGVGTGWNANAPRFGEDLGYSVSHMANLIGIAAGLGAPATLLFGALADRFDNRGLLILALAGQATALAVFWTLPSDLLFTGGVLLFGFSGGGMMPVHAAFVGRLFGAGSFGNVMGLGGLVMLPFGFASPLVAGALRDVSGSYEDTLALFCLAYLVGAALLTLVRPPALEGTPQA